MKTTDQHLLPTFKAFVAAIRDTKLGFHPTNQLLLDAYRLAEERCKNQRLAKEEEKRSADLRKRVTRLKNLVRDWEKLESRVKALRFEMLQEGLDPFQIIDATSHFDEDARKVALLLNRTIDGTIIDIFPSRARGLESHWRPLFPTYKLPRLGFKAAETKFLLDADALLAEFCQKGGIHITKKQHWEIIKTFVRVLFNETVEAKAIEQCVRSRAREHH